MNYKNIGYAVVVAATAAVLVIGSAVPSEAKGKKKEAAAAPPQQQAYCFHIRKPVCAARGDHKMTYANACFAARDGAKVVSEGACKPAKVAKKSGKKKAAAKKK